MALTRGLLLLVAGCGRLGFARDPGLDVNVIDPDVIATGPWGAPSPLVAIPGIVINVGHVYVLRRGSRSEPWGALVLVPELDVVNASQPFVAADGLTLYVVDFPDGGVLVATRASRNTAWSAPALRADLNSPDVGRDAAPRPDDVELVLTTSDGMQTDLALVTRPATGEAWGARQPIAAVNTGSSDAQGCIAAEGGLALYFDSNRSGAGDLYRANRRALDQPFGAPDPIVEINTAAEESDAWVSDDGHWLLFKTDRTGEDEVWMATR